jgi:hypothetical protein
MMMNNGASRSMLRDHGGKKSLNIVFFGVKGVSRKAVTRQQRMTSAPINMLRALRSMLRDDNNAKKHLDPTKT